jgi:anti-sigma factor RsiW
VTCRAARRLLSLFVGGDLDVPETSAVSAHVAACADCRAEVEALSATLSVLPLSTLSFDETERRSVRLRVLDEIAKRQSAPSLAALLTRPRFALAALAGAIVIGAALVAPFLARDAGVPETTLIDRPAPVATPATAGERGAVTESLVPDRPAPVPAAVRTRRARPAAPPAAGSGPAMRLEIQTGNVNVRIIWFVGGPSGEEPSAGPANNPNGVS